MTSSVTLLTDSLFKAIKAHRIAFYPRVRAGDEILDTGARFEPMCQFPSAQIMPLGSHSYSLSGFDPCTTIGRYCSIGANVSVFGDRHPVDHLSSSPMFYNARRFRNRTGTAPTRPMVDFDAAPQPVIIGNDVWIGDGVLLRDGITIGDGAVIGARSVVTKDVAPYTIVGGNPARTIRPRFPSQIADALLALQWWRYDIHRLQSLPTDSVPAFLEQADSLTDADLAPDQRMTLTDLMSQTTSP